LQNHVKKNLGIIFSPPNNNYPLLKFCKNFKKKKEKISVLKNGEENNYNLEQIKPHRYG
jgi:hypothetical protein